MLFTCVTFARIVVYVGERPARGPHMAPSKCYIKCCANFVLGLACLSAVEVIHALLPTWHRATDMCSFFLYGWIHKDRGLRLEGIALIRVVRLHADRVVLVTERELEEVQASE
jgi:hypothetical protein